MEEGEGDKGEQKKGREEKTRQERSDEALKSLSGRTVVIRCGDDI